MDDFIKRIADSQANRPAETEFMHRFLFTIGKEHLPINPDGSVVLHGTVTFNEEMNALVPSPETLVLCLVMQQGKIYLRLFSGNGYRSEPFEPTRDALLAQQADLERHNELWTDEQP